MKYRSGYVSWQKWSCQQTTFINIGSVDLYKLIDSLLNIESSDVEAVRIGTK